MQTSANFSARDTRAARYLRTITLMAIAATAACSDQSPTQPVEPRPEPGLLPAVQLGKVANSLPILFVSDRAGGGTEIYRMNADGSNVVRLTVSAGADNSPSWSPGGKRIAFVSQRDNPLGDIYTMNADGSHVARVTRGANNEVPTWSPDGTKIVFASNRAAADPSNIFFDDLEIYSMDADGTHVVRLTSNRSADVAPEWSPNGKQILFASNRDHAIDGATDLYIMNVDGSNVRRLTTQNGTITDAAWSPDGSQIAFTSRQQASAPGVYVVDVRSKIAKRVASDSERYFEWVSWSPDGTKLSFAKIGAVSSDIFTMNADGTNLSLITPDAWINNEPSWLR